MKTTFHPFASVILLMAAPAATICTAQPDAWTQRADMGSFARANAVAFSLNGKGYLATGSYIFLGQPHEANDLWQYDPALNAWSQKAPYGGGSGSGAAAFSVDGVGYVVGGYHAGSLTNMLWAYDPLANTWEARADMPATARVFAVAFSIGGRGYVGLGEDEAGNVLADFWEYDPAMDTWTARAGFAGGPRAYATGFGAGDKGYVTFGGTLNTYSNELWAYDPMNDSWSARASYPGSGRHFGISFGLNGHGFAGTGEDANNLFEDFQEYDPQSDTWTSRADLAAGVRSGAAAFATDDAGYLATGRGQFLVLHDDLWRYEPLMSAGVDEHVQAPLKLFPIPAHDVIHWEDGSPAHVEVFNAHGQRVINTQLPQGSVELDLSTLPTGLYVLHTLDAKGWQTARFLKS